MKSVMRNLRIGVPYIVFFIFLFSSTIISSPVSSQSTSCNVSPSSDWGDENPEDYLEISTVEQGSFFDFFDFGMGGTSLRPLYDGFSTEWSDGTWSDFEGVAVLNDSATALELVLIPGYRYTFCIDFSYSSKNSNQSSQAIGDIYLMTGSNYDIYSAEFDQREWGDWESIIEAPVEWRDMATWIPYRDSHAYESVSYKEFSIAIDSSGSAWSSLGMDSNNYQAFFLVLDGWDNSRIGDSLASGNTMNVEIIVDMEERRSLPNYTAYFIVGALPLSVIIIPLILHFRYHAYSNFYDSEESIEVPYLSEK
tara:strand:- start:1057 stop:1980 length:924 start_codon:yes stop_codon:yes gene_type:complete